MFGVDLNEKLVDLFSFDFSKADKALTFGGSILLIGILTVFSVLVILWGCLTLFKVFFHDLPARKKAASVEEKAPVAAAPATQVRSNDDEIIAVIAAAIAMAESESSDVKFRVVSFRRK
jgi:sodium pump decarboxylase gamma subunit